MRKQREHDTGPANSSSKVMLLIMLGIIIAAFAAFLVLRPNPSGRGSQSPSSSQHE